MAENKLKSGLAKLTEQSKCFLEDKKLDIDYFGFHQDMENVCEKRGVVSGYLNALVHAGTIELEEAIEMYRYYTK